jgi:hypothetical protein
MKAATLTQFLVDITRGHRQNDFAVNPELLLNSSLLSERMRDAVRKHDIAALWSAGAHPMALLYFARACGWTNDRYYSCISAVELRQAAPSVPAPPSGPELPQTHQ